MPYANCFPYARIGEGNATRSDLYPRQDCHDDHNFAALDGGWAVEGVHGDHGIGLNAPPYEEPYDCFRGAGTAPCRAGKSTGLDPNVGRSDGATHRDRMISDDDCRLRRDGNGNID